MDIDAYPFYFNTAEQKLYFYSDEDGDGIGSYIRISPPDPDKMDKEIYDPAGGARQVAFLDDIHSHANHEILIQLSQNIIDALHSHNNLPQLEVFTSERMSTIDKLGEYEGQPTWNNLA